MKRTQVSKNPAHIPAQNLRNTLRGAASPAAAFSELRGTIPPAEVPRALDWLPLIRHKGRGIFAARYPSEVSDLKRGLLFSSVPLSLEVLWAAHILVRHAEKLRNFATLVFDFERHLLGNRHAECSSVLDTIERQFGISLWSIESRITVLQESEGLEAQKAFATSLRERRPRNDLVAFLIFHVSRRNEQATIASSYVSQLQHSLNNADIKDAYRSYLAFRLIHIFPETQQQFGDILRYEANSSIIDYYCTFVLLSQIAATSENREILDAFIAGLSLVAPVIDDFRIKKSLFVANPSLTSLEGVPGRDLSANNAMLEGRFSQAREAALQWIAARPEDTAAWITAAEASCELQMPIDAPTTAFQISERIRSLLMDREARLASFAALDKLALNSWLLPFGSTIRLTLRRERNSDYISGQKLSLQAFIDSAFLEPRALRDIQSVEYRELLAVTYGETATTRAEQFRAAIAGGASEIPPELASDVALELRTERALRLRQHEIAQREGEALASSHNLRRRRLGAKSIALALAQLGDVPRLIEHCVAYSLTDAEFARSLPLEECTSFLDKGQRRRLANRLSTPIVLHLAGKVPGSPEGNLLSYAYEDCLLANGMTRPSEPRARIADFDEPALAYYLRHICVPNVMHLSTAFRASRELEDERIAVCSLLAEIDEVNRNVYETEAREITRSLTIRRGVRHAEQSKIGLDVDALRRWAEANVRQDFARYQALLKAGMGAEGALLLEAVSNLVVSGTPLPKEFLEVPKSEGYALLIGILESFLRECTLNPAHGLDCYLSMRIRHGTLSGQLRNPLEDEGLISQREGGSRQYKPNEYWLSRLEHVGMERLKQIDARLTRFSRDYDALIDKIADRLIQIRRSDKPEGLFEVIIAAPQVRFLAARIERDSSFDRFLDLCFETFWASVKVCLDRIRMACTPIYRHL